MAPPRIFIASKEPVNTLRSNVSIKVITSSSVFGVNDSILDIISATKWTELDKPSSQRDGEQFCDISNSSLSSNVFTFSEHIGSVVNLVSPEDASRNFADIEGTSDHLDRDFSDSDFSMRDSLDGFSESVFQESVSSRSLNVSSRNASSTVHGLSMFHTKC